MRLPSLCLLALPLLTSCGGSRTPSFDRGVTYFWRLTEHQRTFEGCSDSADFRGTEAPVDTSGGTFFVFRVTDEGKAVEQHCSSLDVGTCEDGPVTYEIAGPEMFWSLEKVTPLKDVDCRQKAGEQRTVVDEGETLQFTSILTLSLEGADKDRIESAVRAQSPNGLGVDGCVVTEHFTASFR